MSKEIESKDFKWASSFYLSQDLPKDWDVMEDDKLFSTLEELAWQPFEYCDGESIYKEIESLSSSVRTYIKQENKNMSNTYGVVYSPDNIYTMKECEVCRDYGFILSNDQDDKNDLQRCDTCNEFKSDEEAKQFVLKFINKGGQQ